MPFVAERLGLRILATHGLFARMMRHVVAMSVMLTLFYPKDLSMSDRNELSVLADQVTANTIFCTKEVLTTDEAARYLGVSKATLYKMTCERQVPHYKSPTGRLCYFNRKEIEAWMQTCKVSTHDELEQKAQSMARKGGRR